MTSGSDKPLGLWNGANTKQYQQIKYDTICDTPWKSRLWDFDDLNLVIYQAYPI